MEKVKQIEVKNRTYYFYNDIFNIGELYSSLQKIDKKSCKGINICSIGYITSKKNGDWEDIYSVNESKYLVFDSTDENKEVWKKYTERWDGIKNEIEKISESQKGEYDKDFLKIKFSADDNLPLNKP